MTREDGTKLDPVLDTVREFRRTAEPPDPATSAVNDTAPTLLATAPHAGFEFRPGMVLGSFVLVRLIGQGGMGQVWEADDTRLPRKVAVKVMRPDLAGNPKVRERFVREVNAQARVLHPHVVPLYQIGEHGGIPYFVMPLLRGETLADRLRREGTLPLAELLRIGRQIAEGLEAAHQQGLIHRDVKPGNVWLNKEDGSVLLLDFGIARSPEGTKGGEPVTTTGTLLGTPAYMAPEQAAGKQVDARADLFSLGVLLYEMSTGEQPFRQDSVYSTLTALATVQPPAAITRRADLPPVLGDLIGRLMEKDPDSRWPVTAGELASLLGRLGSSEAETVFLPPRPTPRRRNQRWLALLLLLLVVPVAYLTWRVVSQTTSAAKSRNQLQAFATEIREQPIEYSQQGVNKNGIRVKVKRDELQFAGTTGVPYLVWEADGTVKVHVPYDGIYTRDFLEAGLIPMSETKSLGGEVVISVVVGPESIRISGFEQINTHGQVTNTGHDAQVCARKAVEELAHRAAEDR